MTAGAIHWVAVLTIHDGALEEFRRLADETISTARANEPGQLVYEWHLSPDGRTCHVDEWYADTAAALEHVRGQAVTEKLPALLATCDFSALWIYSAIADPELRAALEGFGAQFWDNWAGHTQQVALVR
jgi:quinol monooxygenase YgiN